MKQIKVVEVSVQARGAARRYPYHELRIVEMDVGGGYYKHSKGCRILLRSGPRRGTIRLRREYELRAAQLQRELEMRAAVVTADAPNGPTDTTSLAMCLAPETLW